MTNPGGTVAEGILVVRADVSGVERDIEEAARRAADKAADIIRERLDRVKIKINIEFEYQRALQQLQQRLRSVRAVRIRVDLDIAAVRAQLDLLARTRVINIRVDVDTRVAAAELDNLTRNHIVVIRLRLLGADDAILKLREILHLLNQIRGIWIIRIQTTGTGGGGSVGGNVGIPFLKTLVATALALSGPLVGGLLAATAAFGGLGLAGAAALAGIVVAFKANDPVIQGFITQIRIVGQEVKSVAHESAIQFQNSFSPALQKVQAQFPLVSAEVSILAAQLGRIASGALPGIVGGFDTFFPVMTQVNHQLGLFTQNFSAFATGTTGHNFASALSNDFVLFTGLLKQTFSALTSVGAALNRLGPAASEVFGTVLEVVKRAGDALNTAFQSQTGIEFFKSLHSALDQFKQPFDLLQQGFESLVEGILAVARSVLDFLTKLGILKGTVTFVSAIFEGLGFVLKGVAIIIDAFTTGIRALVEILIGAGKVIGDVLTGNFGKIGDDVAATKDQLEHLNDTQLFSQEQIDHIHDVSFNLDELKGRFNTAQDAAEKAAAGQEIYNGVLRQLKIPNTELNTFLGILGTSTKELAKNGVLAGQVGLHLAELKGIYDSSTPALRNYLGALATYQASAKGATDRSALLVAQLQAVRGEFLSQSTAILGAQVASTKVGQAIRDLGDGAALAVQHIANLGRTTGDLGNLDGDSLNKTLALAQAMQAQSDAAIDVAKRMFENNVQTKGVDGAAKIANTALKNLTNNLVGQVAPAFDGNREKAEKYLESLGLIPSDIETLIGQQGAESVEGILGSIRDILKELAKAWGIKITADDQASNRIAIIHGALEALHDKTIFINTIHNNDSGDQQSNQLGADLGGMFWSRARIAIAERTPELVLPFNGHPERAVQLLAKYAPQTAIAAASRLHGGSDNRPATKQVSVSQTFHLNTPERDPEVLARRLERHMVQGLVF